MIVTKNNKNAIKTPEMPRNQLFYPLNVVNTRLQC